MVNRWVEDGLLAALDETGAGSIAFSPLAQGLLTGRYLNGIPEDSRAAGDSPFLTSEGVAAQLDRVRALNEVAQGRGQTLAQMAIAWVLRNVTSALVGASSVRQIEDSVGAVANLDFSEEELTLIEKLLA